MQLLKVNLNIDFLGRRRLAMYFSLALIVVSLGSLATRGLNFGIDFTGGTLIELAYTDDVRLADVRDTLGANGFGDAIVQHFGTSREVLLRIAPREGVNRADLSNDLFRLLQQASAGAIELRRVEFVGPQVGDELTEAGGLAVLYALAGILIYVAFRFEYRFAVASVAALLHDVIIVVGFFSLLQIEFDLTVLAAVLAVVGYSLNDTIVVFDRIRENFRKMRTGGTYEIINRSLNQTLTRTLMTSLTTLLVLVALYTVGGEIISSFALALILGVLVGTYSSIYIASTTMMGLGVTRADLVPAKKEGAELDELP